MASGLPVEEKNRRRKKRNTLTFSADKEAGGETRHEHLSGGLSQKKKKHVRQHRLTQTKKRGDGEKKVNILARKKKRREAVCERA